MSNTPERLEKVISKCWPKPQKLPDMCRKNVQEGDYNLLNDRKLAKLLEGKNADRLSVMLGEYVLYTYEDVRDHIAEPIEVFSGRRVGEFDVERVGTKHIKSLGTRIRHRCELLGVNMSDCERFVAAHICCVAVKEVMDKRWRDGIRRSVVTPEEA